MNPQNPDELIWLILFLPLISAVVITFFTRRNPEVSGQIFIAAVVVSFVLSLALFFLLPSVGVSHLEMQTDWLTVGDLKVDFGIRFDPLSSLMLLVVTGVGGLIHIYSYCYMRGDRGFARFFAALSLFTFSMLGIVLANNLLQLFIFWELVGVSSYLLIGFWYDRPAAADACKKAFITNRLGDFGFLLGILSVWALLGTLNFNELEAKLSLNPHALGAGAAVVGLLLFCGAAGKSAQFPLHVWLPDAMEGPTPVSALIHAATMVAAGVYMLCRILFLLDPSAMEVIASLGAVTALLAALIAVQQNDIKRVLAYSTLSQLGYMVMAVGVGGPAAAMYHLVTHAFFKALLFLGAGSVILALHHEQNIWQMGGLKRSMPKTFWTFLIGSLALCGVPPFSGFFSKDEILGAALDHHSYGIFAVAVVVAALTTFYMTRLLYVAFLGEPRGHAAEHAHESPGLITWPLVILAVPAALAGFWGINGFLEHAFPGHEESIAVSWYALILEPFNKSPLAAFFGLFAIVAGYSAAYRLYARAKNDPLPVIIGALSRGMRNRFYFDELYARIIGATQETLATLADCFDRWIVSGFGVRGVHGTIDLFGRALRLAQTGNLQTYAFTFVAGLAVVLYFALK